jgi:hypothetical protein
MDRPFLGPGVGHRAAVNTILKQDYGANGFIPVAPSRLVASFVSARLKSGQLNQDDIDLVRTLLKQHAFAVPIETKFPASTYQALKPLCQKCWSGWLTEPTPKTKLCKRWTRFSITFPQTTPSRIRLLYVRKSKIPI